MKKIIFSMFLMSFFGFCFISCGGDDDGGDIENSFVHANYMLTEFSKDKTNWSDKISNGLSMIVTLSLTSEGYFTCTVPYASFSGKYKVSGNNHFTFTKSDKADELNDIRSADLKNGILTAEVLIAGNKWYFRNK